MKPSYIHIVDLNSPKKWISFLIKHLSKNIVEKRELLLHNLSAADEMTFHHE